MAVDVENYVGGVPVVVLATDGAKLYGLLCDTGGRLQVVAGSAGVPADVATEATLDAIKTAAEIIDGFANPNNTLFGYQDRYFEPGVDPSAPADTVHKDLAQVSDGEVWIIQAIGGTNNDRAVRIRLQVGDNADWCFLHEETMTVAGQWICWTGECVLKKDDRVRITFSDTIALDDLYWRAWGYKMKV